MLPAGSLKKDNPMLPAYEGFKPAGENYKVYLKFKTPTLEEKSPIDMRYLHILNDQEILIKPNVTLSP